MNAESPGTSKDQQGSKHRISTFWLEYAGHKADHGYSGEIGVDNECEGNAESMPENGTKSIMPWKVITSPAL
jgi:hypothetical protein